MYTAEFNDGINATNAQDFDTFQEARDWCEENMTAEADEVLSDDDFWYGEWTTFADETVELWASIKDDGEGVEIKRFDFGDNTYIVFFKDGVYEVDAEWSDGPAAVLYREPSETAVRILHEDYVDTMAEQDALDLLRDDAS